MQVEYAADLVFRSAGTLKPLYEQLLRESVLSEACLGAGGGHRAFRHRDALQSDRQHYHSDDGMTVFFRAETVKKQMAAD